jgi:hypothetical protein
MSKMYLILVIMSVLSIVGCRTDETQPTKPRPYHYDFQRRPTAAKSCRTTRKPVVIAVIDTGYGFDQVPKWLLNAKLCQFGHRDFVGLGTSTQFGTKDPVPVDKHGHGTNIAGIIDAFARRGNVNYCLVILSYYDGNGDEVVNLAHTVEAINWATTIHADYINYSGGGIGPWEAEKEAVQKFLDQGGTFVAAAGNEDQNLDQFAYFPAMEDPRVVVVGNGTDMAHRNSKSNYGKRVDAWEDGDNIVASGLSMSGTSQSTAIHTGKMVARSKNICK